MADFSELLKSFKTIAREAIENDVPVAVCFGNVTSEKPLKILVDQKLLLDDQQLILTRNVTDYKTDETVDHITEYQAGGSGWALFSAHNHRYVGRKEFTIHHKLEKGDNVVLLRVQGGQKYVVLDRIGEE